MLASCPDSKVKSTADIIKYAYQILRDSYRIEYFYKNTILNELLTDKRFVQDSLVIFNEFKIHKSIADVVYINGKNRVYEIKTELDSPERLANQISDYKKMFSEVNIVTHITLFEKYSQIVKDDSVGIYVLQENLKIENIKKANSDNNKLDLEVILKTLKKSELLSLIINISGIELKIPNMSFFDTCLDILHDYNILDVQKAVFDCLKLRGIKERQMLLNSETPKELKYVCLSLGFSKDEYKTLYDFLNTPSSKYKNHVFSTIKG
ncbi:sce7726 family protein [Spirosoma aerophilum]